MVSPPIGKPTHLGIISSGWSGAYASPIWVPYWTIHLTPFGCLHMADQDVGLKEAVRSNPRGLGDPPLGVRRREAFQPGRTVLLLPGPATACKKMPSNFTKSPRGLALRWSPVATNKKNIHTIPPRSHDCTHQKQKPWLHIRWGSR